MNNLFIHFTGLLLSFAIHSVGFAQSNTAPSVSDNPALEKKVLEVSNELRCLVCQNQTIADSNADLAVDLKNQVRQQLSEGRSKQDILKYMTERYGDFVLYKPPFNAATVMLWVGPFLLMLFGLVLLVRQIKQRKQELSQETFSAQDIERARQLLDRKPGNQ